MPGLFKGRTHMNAFHYYTPTHVYYGKDGADKVGGYVKAEGGTRALIVYGGGSAIRSGLIDRIEASLKEAGISYERLGGVTPNPRLSFARAGVEAAQAFGADFLIAVGGGSVIDATKAIAIGIANPDLDLWDVWMGKAKPVSSAPVGAILTLPAAGSEMSDSAVLTNEETHFKAGFGSNLNRCRFAVMDPSLASGVPLYMRAAGIADIMMHTLERYFIPEISCDLTDEIAEGLLRCVIRNGRKILADPADFDAMGEIMWASSLSHNGLTDCGRGKDFSIHKFGHALTAMYGATHGASLTCIWPAWCAYLYDGAIGRFAKFARRVWGVQEEDDTKAALRGINMTSDYFHEIGMPLTLTELGVTPTDEEFRDLAMKATKDDTVALSRIRPLHAKECEEIFRMAL